MRSLRELPKPSALGHQGDIGVFEYTGDVDFLGKLTKCKMSDVRGLQPRIIIHQGEHNGHEHVFVDEKAVDVYQMDEFWDQQGTNVVQKVYLVKVKKPTVMKHIQAFLDGDLVKNDDRHDDYVFEAGHNYVVNTQVQATPDGFRMLGD